MQWITRINWNGSNYCVGTINEQGDKGNIPVAALSTLEFTCGGTRRIRATTNFNTWKKVSSADFLKGMGFPSDTENGQAVYEFEADGKIFHVPTVVLMKAMFRPLQGMAAHIFRPQGLESIMITFPEDANQPIGFFCSSRKDLRSIPERSESVLRALSWMYCFPSARRMWDSVLPAARLGTLGMKLPEAEATVVLQVAPHAGKWLVTGLTVVAIKTTEVPFEFAVGHPQFIEFHRAINMEPHGRKKPAKQLPILSSRKGNGHLSDSEWALVERIVSKGASFKYSLRKTVDCILEKFGQGIAWKKLAYGQLNKSGVVGAYQRMLKDGRWDALVDALQ